MTTLFMRIQLDVPVKPNKYGRLTKQIIEDAKMQLIKGDYAAWTVDEFGQEAGQQTLIERTS